MKKYVLPIISCLVFILFFIASYFRIDPDFGWHLKTGEYILSHGVPYKDIFTYSAYGHLWVDHEWLSDLFTFLTFKGGGYLLVSVLAAALWSLTVFLSSKRQNNWVVLFATLALLPYAGIRPIVWSLFFFVLLLNIVKNKKWWLSVPFMFLLWANLHGGFIVGIFVLLFFATTKKSLNLFFISFISVVMTFVNPYGIHLYGEIFQTGADSLLHFYVSEWAPFTFAAFTLFYIEVGTALYYITQKKKLKTTQTFFLVLILIFGFLSSRNIPFFILAALPYFEDSIKEFMKRIPNNIQGAKKHFWHFLQFLFIAVIMYGLIHFPFTQLGNVNEYPQKTLTYLQKNGCQGNIFNSYDFGGYLIWKFPEKKVYIDGRMPSWREGDTTDLERYIKVLTNSPWRKEEFQKYHITCALINNKEQLFIQNLQNEGWKKVSSDLSSVLLIQSDAR